MRIGLVCPYDLTKPGGVQSQVLGLAAWLSGSGDEAVIIGPGAGEGGIDLGWSLAVPGNKSSVPIGIDPRAIRRLRGVTEVLDVLHVHEPLIPLASLSALRAGPPVVASFHADPSSTVRKLYEWVGGRLKWILGDQVRAVTAVSQTARSVLPPDMEVVIVPNGLDVAGMRSGVERHPRQVAFLGRDEPRKGLEVLLAAWDDIVGARPDTKLVVMGAERERQDITWMGRVDDDTKARVLGASAVFVAPNTGAESFGIVLVEAMAAGAAVVASDLPAFRDVAGEAARYFATGDSAALSRAVSVLLEDGLARADLAARGEARAGDFDWERVGPAYRAVYTRVLS